MIPFNLFLLIPIGSIDTSDVINASLWVVGKNSVTAPNLMCKPVQLPCRQSLLTRFPIRPILFD